MYYEIIYDNLILDVGKVIALIAYHDPKEQIIFDDQLQQNIAAYGILCSPYEHRFKLNYFHKQSSIQDWDEWFVYADGKSLIGHCCKGYYRLATRDEVKRLQHAVKNQVICLVENDGNTVVDYHLLCNCLKVLEIKCNKIN